MDTTCVGYEGPGLFTHEGPEFYPNCLVITVTVNGKSIDIPRDGQALLFFDPAGIFGNVNVLRSPEEFAEAFPYGIPSDEELLDWQHNAWFDLYTPEGEHLDSVSHTLSDAKQSPKELLKSKNPLAQRAGVFCRAVPLRITPAGPGGEVAPRRGPDPHLSKAFSSALTLRAVSPRHVVALLRK